jgi:very-short-patch-repair endonuclease
LTCGLDGILARWIRFVASDQRNDSRSLARCATGLLPPSVHAWTLLRNRGVLGLKFRRQHVLHGFIVDFYCASERVVIELEGSVHDGAARRSYDRARGAFLAAAGYRIIRVRNKDVSREHFEALLREALGTRR